MTIQQYEDELLQDLYDLPDEELVHTEKPTQEPVQEEQEQQAETADRFHYIKDLFGVYPNIEKCFPGGQLPTERNIHYLYGYLTALYDVDALCQDHYLDCIDELQEYEEVQNA